MKTLFLSRLITFCVFLALLTKRHKRITKELTQEFWDREAKANSTRRKPLNDLNYIHIPLETLPTGVSCEDETVKECLRILESLSTQKIVNLTGYTNTDLKLAYGAPNITLLTEYDDNYTLLARSLQKWAEALYIREYRQEAKQVLEFAISTDTDISHTYYLLADLYDEEGETQKKAALIERAENLKSSLKGSIVRTLQESGPYSDWLHCG